MNFYIERGERIIVEQGTYRELVKKMRERKVEGVRIV